MQHRRNGQTARAKINIRTGERNRHATTMERKAILDQTVRQNHNNQGMIQRGIIIITRRNLSTVYVIIARKRVIGNSNVEPGSTT